MGSEGNLAVGRGGTSKRAFGGIGVGLYNALSDARDCGGCSWIRLLGNRGPRGSFKTVWVFFPVLMPIMTEME